MLALNRFIGQKTIIVVPPSAEPTVIVTEPIKVSGGKVKTAYTAPDEVKIDREEIFKAKQRNPVVTK